MYSLGQEKDNWMERQAGTESGKRGDREEGGQEGRFPLLRGRGKLVAPMHFVHVWSTHVSGYAVHRK